MSITKINPGNKSLEFIDFRIKNEKYRGNPSSEHNRYTMEQIVIILTLLDKYAPNQVLLAIRTTDISKRAENNPEEVAYARFCNEVKQKAGIGTQDAMRKNLFVDLHRMGLIERFDKNKKPTDPFSRQNIKFVSINIQGLKLVQAKNILNRFFIYSRAIDKLLGGHIDVILDILRDGEYKIDSISIYEYMFFVSAVGVGFDFNISTDKAVELIKEFRNLTPVQRKSAIEALKIELNPKSFSGPKTKKRDFHNWLNKIAQIYHLLNQTVYFEKRGDQLMLKYNKDISEATTQLSRSLNEKYQYFIRNQIEKTSGFELHHVVPLSWSENIHHFKILDKWENMVYIDGFSHAKITQNKNRNVVLGVMKNDITLADYSKNEVYLKYNENILYRTINKKIMRIYNKDLLNTVK